MILYISLCPPCLPWVQLAPCKWETLPTIHYWCYVKTESSRLNYLQQNQKDLWVELHQGLLNALQAQAKSVNKQIGKLIIIPSTFQVSLHSKLSDAAKLLRCCGNCRPRNEFLGTICYWKEQSFQFFWYFRHQAANLIGLS